MRRQSGTSDLRALLYMDEVAGYLPPTANPPTKKPIMLLLKQARAFGLGVVLSTQNPVDVDYKALSNAGTWLIGRLQTEQDKARLIDGLSSAAGGVDIERRRRHDQQPRQAAVRAAQARGQGRARGDHHALGDELPARTAHPRPDRRRRWRSARPPRHPSLRAAPAPAAVAAGSRSVPSHRLPPLPRPAVARCTRGHALPRRAAPAPAVVGVGHRAGDGGCRRVAGDARASPRACRRRTSIPRRRGCRAWAAYPVGSTCARRPSRASTSPTTTAPRSSRSEEYEAVLMPLTQVPDPRAFVAVDYDDRDLVPAPTAGAVYGLVPPEAKAKTYWTGCRRSLVEELVRVEDDRDPRQHRAQGSGASGRDERAVRRALPHARRRRRRQGDDGAAHQVRDEAGDRAAEGDRRADQRAVAADGVRLELRPRGDGDLGARQPARRPSQPLVDGGRRAASVGRERQGRCRAAEGGSRGPGLHALEQELNQEIVDLDDAWNAKAENITTKSIPLEKADVVVRDFRLVWIPVA